MLAPNSADLLFGPNAPEEHDLRVASIGHTLHLDQRRYSLGLSHIDRHAKPWRAGEFIVVGARFGHGKTGLAEKIALANSAHHRVLFASLEMPRERLRDRMLSKLMHCSIDGVHKALADDDDDYFMAQAQLDQRDLLVWKPPRNKRSIEAITKRAEDVTADMLVIDYTRLILGWRPSTPAEAIVNDLADWAAERLITTVILTQLRDEAVGKRPHEGHLQDTTQLGQRADRLLMLWRPFLGNQTRDHVAEIIYAKNRWGPCFRAHAHWSGETMDYHDMTDEEEALQLCCKRKRKEEE